MNEKNANRCIRCSVFSCVNNNNDQGYCALDSVTIGTHEPNPTDVKCVDCESFQKKCC